MNLFSFKLLNPLERLAYLKLNPAYPLDENIKIKKDFDFNKLLEVKPTEKDLRYIESSNLFFDTSTYSDARFIDSIESLTRRLKAVVKIKGNYHQFVKNYEKRLLELGFTSSQISLIEEKC